MSVIGSNILAGAAGQGGGYTIERSVRLRSSANAYFGRTFAASSGTTDTFSGWVKRGRLGAVQSIFDTSNGSTTSFGIFFNASDSLEFYDYSSAFRMRLVTMQVFRDPSAWYHIVCHINTTNATAANRAKVYVNGVEVTSFSTATYPAQNTSLNIGGTQAWGIGVVGNYGGQNLDGYLTEVNFIDGQALTPSDFGNYNEDTGVWQPAKYIGSYGTNGFYLPFSDNTNTTTLAEDASGNGNDWTPNNISLTSGVTYDSMTDTPTPYLGGGNYAVLNPLQLYGSAGGILSTVTSNGNLTLPTVAAQRWGGATIPVSSGKWYAEFVATVATDAQVGIYPSPMPTSPYYYQLSAAKTYNTSGEFWAPYPTVVQSYSSWTTGDVIGIAVDLDGGKVWVSKNGTWQGGGSPSAGTSPAVSGLTGEWIIGGGQGSSGSVTANFGQRPFAYTPPTGFKALHTGNLPDSSIVDGSKHFDAVTFIGTAPTPQTIAGLEFQPDLVWVKNRTYAEEHYLVDAVRGASNGLRSNNTAAEVTNGSITAFTSDGFSVGNINAVGRAVGPDAVVAWNWKANGAGVSNTDGSITSTVSANPTSGFSIVTYTGTGATATVGHGLGAAPQFIIAKRRNASVNWFVGSGALPSWSYALEGLNTTAAANSGATAVWNATAPTGSVFSIGTDLSASSGTYIAYCFAEVEGYSKFGSYTGNGSADGVFVYTGFRPAFVMTKSATSASNWAINDSSRSPSNVSNATLLAENAIAESSSYPIDILSNGFKLRTTNQNDSGQTFIFMAFAESPFKVSLAR